MSNELIVQEKKSPIEQYWTPEQAQIVKRTIAPNLTMDEMVIFAHICQRVQLDPFAKQIYAIKRGGTMCIQTAIDGFRLVAERTGKYSPGQDTEFLTDDKGKLIGAKVYVKKQTADGTWHQISATALLSEYSPNSGLWGKMPSVMIEKCAEARALRRAFPADLSGLYTSDEMDQAQAPSMAPTLEETPKIDPDMAEKIEKAINGYEDIRKGLLQICKVKNVSEIKETQIEACRKYVMAQVAKKKEAESVKDESKE